LLSLTEDVLQDIQYEWDDVGNLTQRDTWLTESSSWETETFGYDFLDRLTGASNAYTESYTYDEIGNLTSRNGISYQYKTGGSTKPHAVTQIGATSYTYDDNGNMNVGTARTWDVENRLISITKDGVTTTFVYDGDGNRVKKTVGDVTTLYINQYYEKNLDSGEVTTYYYLGGKMVAQRKDTTLSYIHQDSLGSTSVTSDASGSQTSSIKFLPFGSTLSTSGTLPTDKLFTGQRLDSTGLYYYNSRYYDPEIGRFISADTFNLDYTYPQGFNRYSYCFNNPLRYNDPTGNWPPWDQVKGGIKKAINAVKDGLQVAKTEVVEVYNKVNDAIEKADEIVSHTTGKALENMSNSIGNAGEKVEQVMNNLPNLVSNTIGIESTDTLNTSLAKGVPIIDVKEGSILDKTIFFTDGAVTIYPIGVFTNDPMPAKVKDEESYHWKDQSSCGPFVSMWYYQYTWEYLFYYCAYGFDSGLAHNAISFEREAMGYAGTGSSPPPPFWYWWNQ
jgi:RHS repeat-associated protein